MFGCKCDSVPLLKLSNKFDVYPQLTNDELSLDYDYDDDDNDDYDDVAHEHPFAVDIVSTDYWGNELKYIRQQNEYQARINIKVEQSRQKRVYDTKVKKNR